MRRLLASSALLGLALVPQAVAAPAVGVNDGAGADFIVTTAAGASYEVRLLATVPTQATTATAPRLRVHVMTSGAKRSGDLSAAAFSISGGRPTLKTSLGGVPLRVVWTVDQSTVAASLGEAGSDADDVDGWVVAGKGGTAQVTFGAMRCTTDSVVIGAVVAQDADGYGGPLSQGLGLDLKGARCASLTGTDLPPFP